MLVQQIIIFVSANKLRRSNYGVNMEKHFMKKLLLKMSRTPSPRRAGPRLRNL
jgi:hypothetical protein